ncbi:zinc finger protein 474-like [Cloeon dipterum]|uniref:zinc finger protein 474-like n=1 Tax=Cloeon dipterum TaxID=197152 RepID=UPI0032204DBD
MLDRSRRPLQVVQQPLQRSDSDSSADLERAKRKPARIPISLRSKKCFQERPRPQTATLARPRVLDTSYLTKVDMSLTRKALLNITNLCRSSGKRGGKTPLKAFAKITTSGAYMQLRPNHRPLMGRSQSEADESWEDEDSLTELLMHRNKASTSYRSKTFIRENNNNNPAKSMLGAKKGGGKRSVPEPCRSCGRSDLPERLHSHPVTKSKSVPTVTVTRPVKSSVQRPTPIKYRSNKAGEPPQKGILKAYFPKPDPQGVLFGPKPLSCPKPAPNKKSAAAPKSVSPKRPPASPVAKTNKSPSPKPPASSLKAGGTSPTRSASPRAFVVVEEKAGEKKAKNNEQKLVSSKKQQPAKLQQAACYVCGKELNASLMAQHESKCLEGWQRLNSKLPPNLQKPTPAKKHSLDETSCWNQFSWKSNQAEEIISPPNSRQCQRSERRPCDVVAAAAKKTSPREHSSPRHQQLPVQPDQETQCYLCGRAFATLSLPIHEPGCLRKWRQENDKLAPELRKPEPRPPNNHFSDVLEHEESFGAEYESHLEQLVPCRGCNRTFLPERLEVHTRSCQQSKADARK